ncbi:MAG TPA: universal stress protein [Acidimicrobiales bacterium]
MTRIVAAVDNSTAAQPVLATSRWLSGVLHAAVEALHVSEDGAESVRAVTEAAGIPLTVLDGDPTTVIATQFVAEDVLLGVIGARGGPGGRRPAGHIALAVAQATTKPIVVVPPEGDWPDRSTACRVLAALDDTPASVAAVDHLLDLFGGGDVEVLPLHVFESTNVPRFWDQAHHAAESWGREFVARHLHEPGTRFELRGGAPGICVVDVAEAESVDLVMLSWSQDLSAGRAATVQQVLTTSPVPVLLLPSVVDTVRHQLDAESG